MRTGQWQVWFVNGAFVNCYLKDHPPTLLLDAEAQVSIINIEELAKNFPNVKIQHISSILDDCDTIRVQWG